MIDPGVILLVTWDGGGNVPPMLALGRLLARRGHQVRILGSASLRNRITQLGLDFRAFVRLGELDRSPGTAIEDQLERFFGQLTSQELCDDVAEELDRKHTDVVVIDCMQMAAFGAAEARGISTVVLVHYLPRYALEPSERRSVAVPLLNVSRASLGIDALDPTVGPYHQLWPRCDGVLAATLRQFDDAPFPLPPKLRYVGPILDPDPPDWEWDLPWPVDHPDPLVVVSFSSTYQHQEEQLQRAVDALAPLAVRVLVTVGPGLDPADIHAPAGTVIRQWIPHAAVLPHTTLLITHAGHSTVMQAIAHAVPMVCVPTGRDQLVNANRVQACNLGIALEPNASAGQIRAAVEPVLANPIYQRTVEAMATALQQVETNPPSVRSKQSYRRRPSNVGERDYAVRDYVCLKRTKPYTNDPLGIVLNMYSG